MEDLAFYFKEGWHHIISFDALDHQLFMLVLSAVFLLKDWRRVLIMVTAFTIGHSLTLALSVYDIIRVKSSLVEFLIPCTILVTAIMNFFPAIVNHRRFGLNYFAALFFGLIHGLGFANAIRFMIAKDQHIGSALFGFNCGLEAGQIVVVLIILLISWLIVTKARFPQCRWIKLVSSFAGIWALKMAVERFPF